MLYSALRLGSLSTELTPSSFHPTAVRLAALAMLGTAAFGTVPASAQQASATTGAGPSGAVTATTDCSKYQPGVLMADTKCEILKLQVLQSQGKALDAQAKVLADEKSCLLKLLEFKKAAPEKFQELGTITRANACEAAGRIPKPTASAGPRVGG
jgi:hypothetical protein